MKTILKFRPRGQTYLFVVYCAVLCIYATPTRAAMYGFTAITNNNEGAGDLFAAQLSLEVTEAEDGLVSFVFTNYAGEGFFAQGALTEVYFADGALLNIASILSDPDYVVFTEGSNPKDLPGGADLDPPFTGENTTALFTAQESESGNWAAVDPGESLGILFSLQDDLTFTDVIHAIGLGFTDPSAVGSLRIGIHVREIGGANSDSFILTPVPGAVLLGMLGLGVAGLKLRKFG